MNEAAYLLGIADRLSVQALTKVRTGNGHSTTLTQCRFQYRARALIFTSAKSGLKQAASVGDLALRLSDRRMPRPCSGFAMAERLRRRDDPLPGFRISPKGSVDVQK